MENNRTVLSFGEILWDILPEKKHLGGAPLNCAMHLQRMGYETTVISALGNDELGKSALVLIQKENISMDYITIVDTVPTGFTHVVLENGFPSYEFNNPCAWDCIALSDEQMKSIANKRWSVFIFGSLSQRSEKSRHALYALLDVLKSDTIFFDVNIRKNFYSKEIIKRSLAYAHIVKMNDEEVPFIARLLEYSDSSEVFIDRLMRDYTLQGVIITLGSKGAAAYFNGKKYYQKTGAVSVVDTVGAGDSFSAAFLAAYIQGKSIQESLLSGSVLADYVVSHAGAVPVYDETLKRMLEL